MRTDAEVRAEMLALSRPSARVWPPMTQAEKDALAKWEQDNPEALVRYERLADELEDIANAEEQRREELALLSRLRASGLGERTIEVVRASPAPTPALDAVREWLKTEKTWLLLSGDVGTGKTVAAGHALMHELRHVERRPEGRVFLPSGPLDLSGVVRWGTGAFRRASAVVRMSAFDEGARELALLKSVATLVIDDLGTEHATSWGQSLIHEIFDARHDDKLRTIITTNIKREQLKAALGDRLADRIAQDGRVVHLEGKSMRRIPPEAKS